MSARRAKAAFTRLMRFGARHAIALVDGAAFWRVALAGARIAGLLRPSPVWVVGEGYAQEALGRRNRAIGSYARAARLARGADRARELRWLHVAEFLLERARYRAGRPQVEDPLFACRLVPEGRPTRWAPGFFKADFVFSGLKIVGVALDPHVTAVDITLDGVAVRRINTGALPCRLGRKVTLTIKRSALNRFPQAAALEIWPVFEGAGGRTIQPGWTGNRPLMVLRAGPRYNLGVPHGNGDIYRITREGGGLDKKGVIAPSREEAEAKQNAYLELYDRARAFFDRELGRSLFLMYGTLLGYYREGDFIPGDDDFDCGYVSELGDPLSVKEETKEVIAKLVRAGFRISFNRRGRLFRLGLPDKDMKDVHLDVRPLWFESGQVWAHNHFTMPAEPEHFVPPQEGALRGVKIYAPRETERFLLGHYGPGWKVPDPGFTYHRSELDPEVLRHLAKALISPPEYRELKALLDGGEFVSVAAEALYPLDETAEDTE